MERASRTPRPRPAGRRAGGSGATSPAGREALDRIDLHVHDLRREFACALLESSADLHDVRDFLGRTNITMASRYLAASPTRLAWVRCHLGLRP